MLLETTPGVPGRTTRGASSEGLLPLSDATSHLLPDGYLRTGSIVRVSGGAGATAVALSLVAGPCRAGAWVGCVGFPELGWEAAGGIGLPLDRTVVVEVSGSPDDGVRGGGVRGGDAWDGDVRVKVLAAMVDAFEIVVCGPAVVLTLSTVRRLKARARERGSALVRVAGHGSQLRSRAHGAWPDEDVVLEVTDATWEGLGRGWGNLSRRSVVVQVGGRGPLSRRRHCRVDFDPSGRAVQVPVRSGGVGESSDVADGSSDIAGGRIVHLPTGTG